MRATTFAVLIGLSSATLAAAADLAALDVPLTLRDVAGVERKAEPCTTGVPLPEGLLMEAEGIAVFDAAGAAVPAQFQVLERWRDFGSDGSIKWLGVTFLADVPAGGQAVYRLKAGRNPAPAAPVRVAAAGSSFLLGGLKFAKNFSDPFQLVLTTLEGKQILGGELPVEWQVVENGPVRACIQGETPTVQGKFGYIAWVYAYAGLKRYDLIVVLKNTPREPLGPLCFKDFSVTLAAPHLAKAGRYALGGEPGQPFTGTVDEGQEVHLYQDSDGTDRWDKLGSSRDFLAGYLVSWDKNIQQGKPTFRGYRVLAGEQQTGEGNYALGWATLGDGKQTALLLTRHFHENYPAAVEVAPGTITARLWPKYWQAHHGIHWLDDMQRKRHDLSLVLADGPVAPAAADAAALAFNRPLVAHCGIEWYRRTGVFGLMGGAKLETDVKAGVYPGHYAPELNWLCFGGDCTDRIKRRYHEGSMGRFISGGDPWAAYSMMVTAFHSSGINCTSVDDYQFPRDIKMYSYGQYCGVFRSPGKYPEGTGHHGFNPWNVAHFLCRELFDASDLLDDPLARRTAGEVATYLQNYARWRDTDPQGQKTLVAGTRADGHPMHLLCRSYRLFGGKQLLASCRELTDVMWRQVNKLRGNYGVMGSWEGGADRCEKPFMMCQNIAGLEDYYEITRDERTLDQITGMLDFIAAEASLGEYGFTYVVKLDPGAQEPYRAETLAKMKADGKNSSYANLGAHFAWAYRYTGKSEYRKIADGMNAKLYPYKSQAYTVYFPEKTDQQPAAAVADLKAVALSGGKVKLTWTTPDGAARIQVKYADKPMVERCWPDKVETNANWWAAANVEGEPTPQPATSQSMTVTGLPAGTAHFALRTFDAADNRSEMSNQVQVAVRK